MTQRHLPLLARIAIAFSLYALLHAAVFGRFGPQFCDDAYISFRYAERIAEGRGFTFNDGEAVLGTTTPLWTFLIAATRQAGISLELGVGALEALAAAWLSVVLWRLLAALGMGGLGLAAGPALLIYERWLNIQLMGMETAASIAASLAIVERMIAGRTRGIGFLGAVAAMLRPDGAVIAAMGLLWTWFRSRRGGLREAFVFAVAIGPWIAFSWHAFGSPIPHSIAAKRFIHPASFESLLVEPWAMLWGDAFGRVAMILGGVGLAGMAASPRLRRGWPLAAWLALFCLGLGQAGVEMKIFPWYIGPFAACVWALSCIGIGGIGAAFQHAIEREGRRPYGLSGLHVSLVLQYALLAAILVQCSGFWRRNWREFPAAVAAKERGYLAAAGELRLKLPPGARVLVGEVGVFGYVLPHCEIIDSSGINSPEMLAIRRAWPESQDPPDADAPPRWAIAALEGNPMRAASEPDRRPDLVISLPQFLGAGRIARSPEYAPSFEQVHLPACDAAGLVVLRRKDFELLP